MGSSRVRSEPREKNGGAAQGTAQMGRRRASGAPVQPPLTDRSHSNSTFPTLNPNPNPSPTPAEP